MWSKPDKRDRGQPPADPRKQKKNKRFASGSRAISEVREELESEPACRSPSAAVSRQQEGDALLNWISADCFILTLTNSDLRRSG